jgi:hypothetical protein
MVRTALYEAASVLLTRTMRMSPLKCWPLRKMEISRDRDS